MSKTNSSKKPMPARLHHCAISLLALFGASANTVLADVAAASQLEKSTDASLDKVVDMSLFELQQVKVTAGSLDGSELRKAPATITTITSQNIRESGARNLNELLEIYVPNLLYLRHNWEASHVGIRGAIGDIDNGFLILVNGRVMNNYAHAGAIDERNLNLLGDIKEIQVVRGPGSAVYGAGALIGVIDIQTYTGETFNGTEVTATAGELEQFYNLELKNGFKFGKKITLFTYAGISDLIGANGIDAPLIPGLSGQAFNGTPVIAGQRYPLPLAADRQSYSPPDLKFHAELTFDDDFSLWARYTRGGETQPLEQRWLLQWPQGFITVPPGDLQQHGVGTQQIAAGADYKHQLSDHWSIAARLGYGNDNYIRREFDGLLDANREDIYTARLLATWQSGESHSLTFGAEYLHGEFGLPPLGYPGGPAQSVEWGGLNPIPGAVSGFMPRWSSDTYSFLAEDHWDINSQWSLFTDLRIDKNDHTGFMYSPRAALVYTPTRSDTFKLIASQATKADVAETLEFQRETTGSEGDTETLDSFELDYNRMFGDHFSAGINTFYNDFKPIGWNEALGKTQQLGDEKVAGAELEVAYQAKNLRIGLSHGYSQLISFSSDVTGIESQAITAEPFGFGHDLNHWSTHITKLQIDYDATKKLHLNSSLRVFWGWPGFKDYTDYANAVSPGAGYPLEYNRDPGYNPYSRIQARLNMGVTYNLTRNCSIDVHGYNLLGLFDGHLNDRFIMFSSSAAQDAVGVAVKFSCKF